MLMCFSAALRLIILERLACKGGSWALGFCGVSPFLLTGKYDSLRLDDLCNNVVYAEHLLSSGMLVHAR